MLGRSAVDGQGGDLSDNRRGIDSRSPSAGQNDALPSLPGASGQESWSGLLGDFVSDEEMGGTPSRRKFHPGRHRTGKVQLSGAEDEVLADGARDRG